MSWDNRIISGEMYSPEAQIVQIQIHVVRGCPFNFSYGKMTSEWVGFEQTGHYLTTIYQLSSLNYSYTSIYPPHYLYLSISPNFALLNCFLLWRDDGDCHVPTHSGQLFTPGTRVGERGAHPRGGSGRRVTNIETF
jgi:hypothetical protein